MVVLGYKNKSNAASLQITPKRHFREKLVMAGNAPSRSGLPAPSPFETHVAQVTHNPLPQLPGR